MARFSAFAPGPFFKGLLFKATVTLAWGRTDINRQKTACSEKLTQSKITAPPQPVTIYGAGWGCSAIKCHREAAAETTFPCAFPSGSYLALAPPPVIPSHEVLVILILLGQVVIQDAVRHRLQRHGESGRRRTWPLALRGRRPSGEAAFRPCSCRTPCHPGGSAATAGFPLGPQGSPFGMLLWALPAGRGGRSTSPW